MRTTYPVMMAAGLMLAWTGSAVAQDDILDIRNHVSVVADTVLLRDLLVKPDLFPSEMTDQVVLTAPAPGNQSRHSLVDIAYALQDVPSLLPYHLRGPDSVVVKRTGNNALVDVAKQRIADAIARTPPWTEWEIDVSFSGVAPFLQDVGDFASVDVQLLDDMVLLGSVGMLVTFRDDAGNAIDHRRMAPTVRRRTDGIMLRERLDRGHVITAEDVKITTLWVGDDHRNLITRLGDCLGKELARSLPSGEMLREQVLLEPLCAQRGDMVWVNCSTGGLDVRMSARAVKKGRRGETIRVENPVSQRQIQVSLTGPRVATLDI